jgi:hypothetical protein
LALALSLSETTLRVYPAGAQVGESTVINRLTPILFISICLITGCGGSKVLKEPEPLTVTKPLATASDQHLTANLDWVIVRDGPGGWAKNVDWDEYLMRVQNLSDQPIRITTVTVFDSLGSRIEIGGTRRELVDGTKEVTRRYKDEGLKVKAGAGSFEIAGTVVAGATGVAVGAAAASYGAATAAAVGVAAAGLVLIPVAAVGAIRGMNNKEVNEQIESRQTLLPAVLPAAQEQRLDLFFPLAPSPRQIEMAYVDSLGEYTLVIDTRTVLDGLHLARADE